MSIFSTKKAEAINGDVCSTLAIYETTTFLFVAVQCALVGQKQELDTTHMHFHAIRATTT